MNPRRFAARIVRGAQRRFDLMLPARMPKSVEVVSGMATMPTRDATFPTAFKYEQMEDSWNGTPNPRRVNAMFVSPEVMGANRLNLTGTVR
jgi:hypothetical protein